MRKAVLVVGPESSGTRMVTKLLVRAGYTGDYTHEQRFDLEPPRDETLVVWRRSVPHGNHDVAGRETPPLAEMTQLLKSNGYEVTWLVCTRDMVSMAKSQAHDQRHTPDLATAFKQIEAAYRYIYEQSALAEPALVVTLTYEQFVLDTRTALKNLGSIIGKQVPFMEISNENSKWS